jgi:hypothetical protein
MPICFLSSQMSAIGGFSALLNGFRPGHPSQMSSRQKQETPSFGLSETYRSPDAAAVMEFRTVLLVGFPWQFG